MPRIIAVTAGLTRVNKITFVSSVAVSLSTALIRLDLLRGSRTTLPQPSRQWHGAFGQLNELQSCIIRLSSIGSSKQETTRRRTESSGRAASRSTRCIRNFCWLLNNKIWLWTAVDPFQAGILGWVFGRRDYKTFEPLWQSIKT